MGIKRLGGGKYGLVLVGWRSKMCMYFEKYKKGILEARKGTDNRRKGLCELFNCLNLHWYWRGGV